MQQFFFYCCVVLCCVNMSHFILLLIEILVVYIFGDKMNKTVENILVHVCGGSTSAHFLLELSGNAGSQDMCMFNFSIYCQTVFQSDCTSLYPSATYDSSSCPKCCRTPETIKKKQLMNSHKDKQNLCVAITSIKQSWNSKDKLGKKFCHASYLRS